MVTVSQLRAARAMIGWSQDQLAERSGVSKPTIARLELAPQDSAIGGYASTSEKLVSALEAAGVIFVEENGEGPGVRLKKTMSKRLLDERERAETAKTLAREWTAYCKEHNSMAFASASGDLILIQFRNVGSLEVFNSLTVRVLDQGFELDGKTVEKGAMERVVFAEMESHPYRI
jgi:transcriptional regulator with XRE-family HTH domain